jgi:hypothetical protein
MNSYKNENQYCWLAKTMRVAVVMLFVTLPYQATSLGTKIVYAAGAAVCENDPNLVLEGDECVEYAVTPTGDKVVISRTNLPTGRVVSFYREPVILTLSLEAPDPALQAVQKVDNLQTLAYLTDDVWINASDVSVYQFGAVQKSEAAGEYTVDLKGSDDSGSAMLSGKIHYSVNPSGSVDHYALTYSGGEDEIDGQAKVYLFDDGAVRLAVIDETKSSARVTGTNQVKIGYDAAGIIILEDNRTQIKEMTADGGTLQTVKTVYFKNGTGYEKTETTRRDAKGRALSSEKINSELGPGAVVLSTSSTVAAYAYDPATGKKIMEIMDTTRTTSDGYSHTKHVYNTYSPLGTPDIRSTWSEQVSESSTGKSVIYSSSSQNYSTNRASLADLLGGTVTVREERYDDSDEMTSRSQVVTSSQAGTVTDKRTTEELFDTEAGNAVHETVEVYAAGKVAAVSYRVETEGRNWSGSAVLDASGAVTGATYQEQDAEGAPIGEPVTMGPDAQTDIKETILELKESGTYREDEVLRALGLLNNEGKVGLLTALRAYVQADRSRTGSPDLKWDLNGDGGVDSADLTDLNTRLRGSADAGPHVPVTTASGDILDHGDLYDQALADVYSLTGEAGRVMNLADLQIETAEVDAAGKLSISLNTNSTTPNSSYLQQTMEAQYDAATGERTSWRYTQNHYESFAPDPVTYTENEPYSYDYSMYSSYGSRTSIVDESVTSDGTYHKSATETNDPYGSYGYYGYAYGSYGPTTSRYEYTLETDGDFVEESWYDAPMDYTYYYYYTTPVSTYTLKSRQTDGDGTVTLRSISSNQTTNYYGYYNYGYGYSSPSYDERTETFFANGDYHLETTSRSYYDYSYGYGTESTSRSSVRRYSNGDYYEESWYDSPDPTYGASGHSVNSRVTSEDGTVTLRTSSSSESYNGSMNTSSEERTEVTRPGGYYRLEEHRSSQADSFYGSTYDRVKTVDPETDSESETIRESSADSTGIYYAGYESKNDRVGQVTTTDYTQYGSMYSDSYRTRTYQDAGSGKSYTATLTQPAYMDYGGFAPSPAISGSVTIGGKQINFQSSEESPDQIVFDYEGGRVMESGGDLDGLCSFLATARIRDIAGLNPRQEQQQTNEDLAMLDQQSAMWDMQQDQMSGSDPNMTDTGFNSPY